MASPLRSTKCPVVHPMRVSRFPFRKTVAPLRLGWAKSLSFATGQCPVMSYHRNLMQAILFDKIAIDKAVGVEVISLDDAPRGYADFDKGASKKFVIDPHNYTGKL